MSKAKETFPHPGKLLPSNKKRDLPLFMVMTVLVFLACLSVLGAITTFRTAQAWTGGLTNQMTIKLMDPGTSIADARSIEDEIAQYKWIKSANLMSRAQTELLIAPWFGNTIPQDLPLPKLIAVELAEDAPANATEHIQMRLEEHEISAEIDDHQQWADDVGRTSSLLRSIALTSVILLTLATSGVIIFATQAGLVARKDVVDVMFTIGASRRSISWLFADKFMSVGFQAGLLGTSSAILMSWLFSQATVISPQSTLFIPAIRLYFLDLICLSIVPFITALIAMLTAGITVWRHIR